MPAFREQLRRHSVALISLAVALTSLAYNTWRNEQTEANRNVRTAGIEFLLRLGQIEEITLVRHFDMDPERGSVTVGWSYALTARDLADLTAEPAIGAARHLFEVWEENSPGLGNDDGAQQRISDAIDRARADMLGVLAALD